MLAHFVGGFGNIETTNRGVARISLNKRRQDIDDSCFAGTVAAEQRKNRPAFNCKVDSFEDGIIFICFFFLCFTATLVSTAANDKSSDANHKAKAAARFQPISN